MDGVVDRGREADTANSPSRRRGGRGADGVVDHGSRADTVNSPLERQCLYYVDRVSFRIKKQ